MTDPRRETAKAVNRLTRLLDRMEQIANADGDPDATAIREEIDDVRGLLLDALDAGDIEAAHSTRVKFKRGEGTRDEDEWRLESTGATPEGSVDALEEQIDEVEERLVSRVRSLQPE